jgi:translation initiation factor 2 beta subunit (eIF-2beta)/eIF-5
MYIKYNKAKNYILCEMIIDKQIGNNLCVYIAIYTNAYNL